jgi:hypothetical protein
MTFLAPLYILGALAVVGPIVFHLIRRTTRGEVPFSSLMFLAPSPPRLTRRSRIDHWLLLLLRAVAVGLLAFAFARPFLRETAGLPLDNSPQRRVVVLVDTSASMRRNGLWAQAQARAREAVDACRPGDHLALYAFDVTARPVLGFEATASLDPAGRKALAHQAIAQLAPTWAGTHLGQALIDAMGAIEDVGDEAHDSTPVDRRIVLVADLQRGSRVERLGDFEWPRDVELELLPVGAAAGANASLQLVANDATDPTADDEPEAMRVRVTNEAGAVADSFQLAWDGEPPNSERTYVPPGESRVVRLRRPTTGQQGRILRLEGDGEPFDNTLFLASAPVEAIGILYLGDDRSDDPTGLAYYLNRAVDGIPGRHLELVSHSLTEALPESPGREVRLIVIAGETAPAEAARLRQFAEAGGTVLFVATATGNSATLAALAGVPEATLGSPLAEGDTILGEIAFDHPIFAPFAAPQFNDFTRIKFWKHRLIAVDALEPARVLARFEHGEPALVEKTVGQGRLLVLASGWSPADSQLARSSKFVPLIASLLDRPGEGLDNRSIRQVGEPLPLPEGATSVTNPEGALTSMAVGTPQFLDTGTPGIYTINTRDGRREVAVNLDPLEGRTEPMEPETFERYGCRIARTSDQARADMEASRQLRNAELEGRQKLWRPLILALIGVLVVETLLAGRGRSGRSRSEMAEGAGS